jgi:chromosome segregation ATPase
MGTIYAAQENVEDYINSWDGNHADRDDIADGVVQELIDAIEEVTEEYREAAEAMGEGGTQHEERADELEGYRDEVESMQGDLDEFDGQLQDDDETPLDAKEAEDWASDIRSKVEDALGNCPL